jgi:hypothetical protein
MTAEREAVDRKRHAAAARRERTRAAYKARRDAARGRQNESVQRARLSREVSLVDLVDRLLDGGVVIHGDITIAIADVDLLYVGLRALVSSVENMERSLGVAPSAKSPALAATPR